RPRDSTRRVLCDSTLRPERSVSRLLRARDERIFEIDRVAGRGEGRHPWNEQAMAAREGGLARLRSRVQSDGARPPAVGAGRDTHLDRRGLVRLKGSGEERRRAQAPDAVAVILKRVVAPQPLPTAARAGGHAHRSEAVTEAVADEGARSPRLGRG